MHCRQGHCRKPHLRPKGSDELHWDPRLGLTVSLAPSLRAKLKTWGASRLWGRCLTKTNDSTHTSTSNGHQLGSPCIAEQLRKLADSSLLPSSSSQSRHLGWWCSEPETGLGVKLDHKQNLWAALLTPKAGSSTDDRANTDLCIQLDLPFGYTSPACPLCPTIPAL